MVSSSKILTVSYGTFSCTAEGFEDPLAVMKDTTQFFRSVVGEDRFFGAEPPQFDPELASELMRQQISAPEGGQVRLDLPGAGVAASSGAMAAALAAGPARAKAVQADPGDDHLDLPDDDTIDATAYEPEIASDAQADDTLADHTAPEGADDISDDTALHQTDDLDLDALLVEDADQAATLAEPVRDAPAPRPTGAASVAAKLDRIRAVVADSDSFDTAEDEGVETPPAIEDEGPTPVVSQDVVSQDVADTAELDAEPDMDALSALLQEAPAAEVPSEDILEEIVEQGAAKDDDNLFTDTIAGLMQADLAPQEEVVAEAEPDVEQVIEAAFDEDESFDLVSALDQVDKVEKSESDAFAAWDSDADGDDTTDTDIAAAIAGLTDTAFDDEEDDALFNDEAEVTVVAEPEPTAPEAIEDDMPLADAAVQAEPIAEEAPVEPVQSAAPARPPVRARVIKVKRSTFDKAIATGQLEEVSDEPSDVPPAPPAAPSVALPAAPVETAPLANDSSLSLEEEDELARELAAVKAELAGELDDWDDESEDNDVTPVAADPAPKQTQETLEEDDWGWDDEEDDLVAETSEPLRLDNPVSTPDQAWDDADQAEASDEDGSLAAAIDGARKAVKMASPARAMLTEQSVEDNDTSRILDQTNTELEEPEGNRRRSAIAHLRAAVAATKADRLLGRKRDAEEEFEPYREDLASVVRPRRPQAGTARTERPSAEPTRSAPLKLVAEQRVAEPTSPAEPAAPVRPRRVNRVAAQAVPTARSARPQENVAPEPMAQPSGDSDFAAYAESVGANGLPELLEAAAAYMSYVEGLDQFSRPQLMTTVRQAEATESSREDRLRSFGQLLREGKIEKTSGGRFTASERISFKPSRAAG